MLVQAHSGRRFGLRRHVTAWNANGALGKVKIPALPVSRHGRAAFSRPPPLTAACPAAAPPRFPSKAAAGVAVDQGIFESFADRKFAALARPVNRQQRSTISAQAPAARLCAPVRRGTPGRRRAQLARPAWAGAPGGRGHPATLPVRTRCRRTRTIPAERPRMSSLRNKVFRPSPCRFRLPSSCGRNNNSCCSRRSP